VKIFSPNGGVVTAIGEGGDRVFAVPAPQEE
jgi:hypothetical protein